MLKYQGIMYRYTHNQKGVFMKRIFRTLIIAMLSVLFVLGMVACGDNGDGDGKTGLLYKMYSGDDYYTVYGYVDEGKNITSLDIASYVKEKSGEDVKIGRIKADAFKNNDTLTEIIVPTTVEVMDKGAFGYMKKLESLTLPFIGNTKNADVTFNGSAPSEDKSVDAERTLAYLFGETEYEEGIKVTQFYAEGGEEGSNNVERYLPKTLKNITVTPAEKYDIPMYAFAGNGLIKKVTLNNVGVIGDSAFKDAIALEEVSIPATTTTINKEAFSGCVNLKTGVTFEANSTLASLGEGVFKGCANLKNISLPNSLQVLSKNTFSGCADLSVVKLGGVNTIKGFAFDGCASIFYVGKLDDISAINKITIDFTGLTVEDFAFANTLTMESDAEVLGANALDLYKIFNLAE